MRNLGRVVGYLFILLVVAWNPAAIVFVFMGVWGDSRWALMGGLMLLVGIVFAIVVASVLSRRKTSRDIDFITIDRKDIK